MGQEGCVGIGGAEQGAWGCQQEGLGSKVLGALEPTEWAQAAAASFLIQLR